MDEIVTVESRIPKNVRQVGDGDQTVRFYVEDYVNTYLKRLIPTRRQDLRVGLLLGSLEYHEDVPYIMVDGALEMPGSTEGKEEIEFTQEAWTKASETIQEIFPGKTIQGWFLCGMQGSQLSPLNYWKLHSRYFTREHQVMYLNSGLDGEEAVYVAAENGFYRLRGYYVFYERNQMMQDYMIACQGEGVLGSSRTENGVSDQVIQNFHSRMNRRRTAAHKKNRTFNLLGTLCAMMAVCVMSGAVVIYGNYNRMRKMEEVIASVLPGEGQNTVVVKQVHSSIRPTTEAESSQTVEQQVVFTEGDYKPAGQSTASQSMETQRAAVQQQAEVVSRQVEAATQTTPESQQETSSQTGEDELIEIYTVQEGETLYGICLKTYHNLSRAKEVCALNGLQDENHITAGQKLKLPR